jgi:hypothetical protein
MRTAAPASSWSWAGAGGDGRRGARDCYWLPIRGGSPGLVPTSVRARRTGHTNEGPDRQHETVTTGACRSIRPPRGPAGRSRSAGVNPPRSATRCPSGTAEVRSLVPAERRRSVMTVLVVQHRVRDFDAWKPVFDEDESRRRDHGAQRHWLYRTVEDPNDVVVAVEFPSADAARSFTMTPGCGTRCSAEASRASRTCTCETKSKRSSTDDRGGPNATVALGLGRCPLTDTQAVTQNSCLRAQRERGAGPGSGGRSDNANVEADEANRRPRRPKRTRAGARSPKRPVDFG